MIKMTLERLMIGHASSNRLEFCKVKFKGRSGHGVGGAVRE